MTESATTTSRSFAGDADVASITRFLLDTYALNQNLRNWEPRRWEGSIYHRSDVERAGAYERMAREIRIWENESGQIIGVALTEYPGGLYMQVHPHYREIEAMMLEWAEANLAQPTDDGKKKLEAWRYDDDTQGSALLRENGYEDTGDFMHLRRLRMDAETVMPTLTVPDGYRVRAMRLDPDDQRQMADVLNAGFNSNANTAESYRLFQEKAPIYDAELDIVVEGPDGVLVSTAGFTCDTGTRFGILEPCATHPKHQGKGLAQAAISEGLRRLQARGIDTVYVGVSGTEPIANHVYNKLGFTEVMRDRRWRKVW